MQCFENGSLMSQSHRNEVIATVREAGVKKIAGDFPPELRDALLKEGFFLESTMRAEDVNSRELHLKDMEMWTL